MGARDVQSKNCTFYTIKTQVKSTGEVAEADHHVVQEDPRGVAQAIWSILKDEYAS